MLYAYNADRKGSIKNNFIFKHLSSSPVAAAERIESMFAHQETCSFNEDLSVDIRDLLCGYIGTKTLDEHLQDFCEHTREFHISEYALDIKRPLRLKDLWEDDPIGSGGPDVVDIEHLKSSEKEEIKKIFYPFESVIHPNHVFKVMSNRDIKKIKRRYNENSIFKAELKKRKFRSKSIGEDFRKAQFQEIVWLDLTFKLKTWALERGYDSFVYKNFKEGRGEDSFVTLRPNQVKETGKSLQFLEQKYLDEIPSAISIMVQRLKQQNVKLQCNLLWGQQDPMRFWG
ncbi:hypothetical protein CWC05_01895 [Pseudoalteromonas ruthenica]|uniref:Uncharacterized protein n=1 Tax=Pseudoalteromonas ruthenica TaxID=151081 RepID=A0A5S3Z7H2_9GAMM|nr:hypothetical protein [Pseudoalteromonas ruthenica]TMP88214.1 hypothetical protein CWC05_01895 [Pseudoalteromonas ruthenica]